MASISVLIKPIRLQLVAVSLDARVSHRHWLRPAIDAKRSPRSSVAPAGEWLTEAFCPEQLDTFGRIAACGGKLAGKVTHWAIWSAAISAILACYLNNSFD